MTLNQCTKEELILIINKMIAPRWMSDKQRQERIKSCLLDIELLREQKALTEAEYWNTISHKKRSQYVAIMKPYNGKRIIEIPVDVIKTANRLLEEAQEADEKWKKIYEME